MHRVSKKLRFGILLLLLLLLCKVKSMDDNCGEWVKCMGVVSGSGWNLWVWLAGGGCGWNLWVWLVGVVVKRYIYRFPRITSLLLLYPFFFAAASLLFVHKKNMFFIYLYRDNFAQQYINRNFTLNVFVLMLS